MSQQVASEIIVDDSNTSPDMDNDNQQIRALQPYFILKLFISNHIGNNVRELYVKSVDKHNTVVNKCIYNDYSEEFDAGFDLFVPVEEIIPNNSLGYKMNHMVKCSMNINIDTEDGISNQKPVGYYLYPRSSTGTKSPLRLSNSVGIIDSGYRGNIIAAFDNIAQPHEPDHGAPAASFDNRSTSNDGDFKVERGSRVVQICPPNLCYPILVKIVDNESDLGTTNRGEGGFGSTGI